MSANNLHQNNENKNQQTVFGIPFPRKNPQKVSLHPTRKDDAAFVMLFNWIQLTQKVNSKKRKQKKIAGINNF